MKAVLAALFSGALFGIGLAFVLVFSTLMEFGRTEITVTILIGVVFGVLWGLLGPARSPKAPPPEPVPSDPGDTRPPEPAE